MAAPENSPWASTTLTNITGTVPGEGTVLYNNKTQPSAEIQANGLLLGTSLPFQWINYQFDMIYQNIEYLKNPEQGIITETTTSRTFTLADRAKHIRFTSSSASSYVINQGVATIGTKITIRQSASGVVSASLGSGVTPNLPTGKAFKTNGLGSVIYALKVTEGVGVESWDVWGDLGT